MWRYILTRGLIIATVSAVLGGVIVIAFAYSYRATENRNFAILREKAELDCATMPYHCAIKESSTEKITALKKSGADINGFDRFGNTPLLYALSWGLPFVDPLLELGADPNIPNESGLTPLEQSLNLGNYPLAEKLIAQGANPNTKAAGAAEKYLTLLNRYITERNVPAASFLVEHGADASLKDGYGYTACERAAMYDNAALFPFCSGK